MSNYLTEYVISFATASMKSQYEIKVNNSFLLRKISLLFVVFKQVRGRLTACGVVVGVMSKQDGREVDKGQKIITHCFDNTFPQSV